MEKTVASQRRFFDTNITKDVAFRIAQLKKLKKLLQDYEDRFNQAIYEDFGKSPFENITCELAWLHVEIDEAVKKIKTWAACRKVRANLLNFPATGYLLPEPFGISLIIGAWNYPYLLSFGPAIAALAAGNTVILKPSELTSHTAAVMAEIINRNFDPSYFIVVEGGIPETQELLNQRFDKIFFTGSVAVGRIVCMAAARHLTPVTLELGGKNPVFILDNKNMKMYVKRLVWAKFLNAGQSCVAPDYALVPKSLEQEFLDAAIAEIKAAHYSLENQNYVRIINERNMTRLRAMLDPAKVRHGGTFDVGTHYFEPTIMYNVNFGDPVMQQEIFGPILPVISFDSLDDVIAEVKRREKPLSCYIFTRDKRLQNKILKEIPFGGGAVNDAAMHIVNSRLPFGGVGESGMGSYHGEYGFRTFSHLKGMLDKSVWVETDLKYFPRTPFKLDLIKRLFRMG